jgi:CheY-like chemotaxis protein
MFKHLLSLVVAGLVLNLVSPLRADDPPKEPPKKDPLQKQAEEYEFFFGKPANIPDYWAAMQYEISVGRQGVAAMFLEQMLDFASKLDEKARAEEWLKLERKESMAGILALNNIRQWYGSEKKLVGDKIVVDQEMQKKNDKARSDVANLVKQVSAAVRAYIQDPVRIAKYVTNLTASPEERDYALSQLYESGVAVVPELVAQLQQAEHTDNADARVALREALPKLSRDTVPPLLAALDSNDPILMMDVMDVIQKRADKRAIPRLWWVLGNPDQHPGVRAAARKTLAYLTETKEDRLPQPKEMLTQQAELFYQHRIEFSNPESVTVWRWDSDAKRIVSGWEKLPGLTAGRAEEYWGHRLASEALTIDPTYLPAQIVDLSLILDKAVERVGLDVPLSQAPSAADVNKVLTTVNPDLVIRVLERALKDKRTNVVLATVRALGELGEVRATHSTSSEESPLLRAMNYGDRRVEFAAAEAFLHIPGKPAPGVSTRVIETLRRAIAVDQKEPASAPKALIGYANDGLNQAVAVAVKTLGYEPVTVRTGRDVMRRLNQASDIDIIIIDAGLPDPGLANLLAQIRADVHAARLPVIVAVSPEADESLKEVNKQYEQERAVLEALKPDIKRFQDLRAAGSLDRIKAEVDKHERRLQDLSAQYARESIRAEEKLRRFVERNNSVWVVNQDVPLMPERLGEVIKEKVKLAENAPLPDAVRKEYTERSIQWLGRIAKGEFAGYDLRSNADLPQVAYESMESPTLSPAAVKSAIEIAGRLGGKESQRHLLVFLCRSTRAFELRRLAGDELVRNIQANGNQLSRNDMIALFDMYKDESLDKTLRPVVNALVGLMQPDDKTTGGRLKGFDPKIPPPAPPGSGSAPPPEK